MTDTSGGQPPAPSIAAPPSPDRRGDIIAFGVLGLVALVIVLVFLVVILGIKVDPVELTLLTLVVGAPITALGVITGFQFGSSKGSQAKDAQIAALTPTTPTTSA